MDKLERANMLMGLIENCVKHAPAYNNVMREATEELKDIDASLAQAAPKPRATGGQPPRAEARAFPHGSGEGGGRENAAEIPVVKETEEIENSEENGVRRI